jgi:hypothetical protein
MKITHRNAAANWFNVPPSAVIEPEYEAEVRRSTDHGEREYQRSQQRLARAETRLASARAMRKPLSRKHLAELVAVVELRRAELEEYRRMMTTVAASAQHRGVKDFRPVPPVRGIPL